MQQGKWIRGRLFCERQLLGTMWPLRMPWAWATKAIVFKCCEEKHPALSPHTNPFRSRGEYLKVPDSLQIKLPGHAQNVS